MYVRNIATIDWLWRVYYTSSLAVKFAASWQRPLLLFVDSLGVLDSSEGVDSVLRLSATALSDIVRHFPWLSIVGIVKAAGLCWSTAKTIFKKDRIFHHEVVKTSCVVFRLYLYDHVIMAHENMKPHFIISCIIRGSVAAKRLRAPNSNSGVSDQQSVGLNPQLWHLCP